MTQVSIRTDNGWETVDALVDSGATLNFVSQHCVQRLQLKVTNGKPPRICTIDGNKLQTYGVHQPILRLTDRLGMEVQSEERLIAASMTGYDLVLGMPWLQSHNPDIDWVARTWTVRARSKDGEEPGVAMLSAAAFCTVLNMEVAPVVYAIRPERVLTHSHGWGHAMSTQEVRIPEAYRDFAEVFSEAKADELPEHGPQDHAIDLHSGTPPFGPLYNLSNTELKVLRTYLDDNLTKGFIRESSSPAGAPILFVKKKDGSLRLCVDYRGLNRLTIKNRYPLPLISEALDRLVGAQVYTKLDIRSAYNLIRIKEGDEWKTAFRTRYGHFEYRVMPFGLANAPATFQGHINAILRDYLDVFCIAYLDDILIYSEDPAQHTEHVRRVLERLQKHNLYVKLEKCEFHTKQVGFVGFIITPGGVSMERSRIAAIQDWPIPKTHRDVQVFLGFANFYRRFIYGYSKITKPLSSLLEGGKAGKFSQAFVWTPEAERAFNGLKESFTTAPILVHYNPELPLRLETDACGYAIAGILSQPHPLSLPGPRPDGKLSLPGKQPDDAEPAGKRRKTSTQPEDSSSNPQAHWHPVAYWSRSMTAAERNYGGPDQELLAIVMCCKQWRHYIEGAEYPVTIVTDHCNLRTFMTTKGLVGRQARWWELLSGYHLEVVYRPGKLNNADGPSRRPDYAALPEGDETVQKASEAPQRKLHPTQGSQETLVRRKAVSGTKPRRQGDEPRQDLERSGTVRVPMLAGADVLEHLVPRHMVAVAASGETVYDDASEDFLEAISRLQEHDPLAKGVRSYLLREKPKGGRPGVDSGARRASDKEERPFDDPMWHMGSNGILYYGEMVYIPPAHGARTEVLRKHHDDPLAGHFGYTRTLELIRRKYYWPGMSKEVRTYVRQCTTCCRIKPARHKPYGQLKSLQKPAEPWSDMTMDFITDLPPCNRSGKVYDSILVVMDRYTKMARYIPVQKTIDASELARILVRKLVLRGTGLPQSIVSDRGSVFTAKYWSALCFYTKVRRRLSTAYHPQTDGQTERQNQTLEQYLRAYINYQQDDWVEWLRMAEFAYNNSIHASTGVTPFFAMHGFHPRMEDHIPEGAELDVPAAKDRIESVLVMRKELEARWQEAVKTQATYYDEKRTPRNYAVGQQVWLSAQNIRTTRPNRKLDFKRHGPFRILDAVGKQAYRLELPKSMNIHPVFHVSLLEPYVGSNRTEDAPPPVLVEDEEEYEVEQVLDSRLHYRRLQYLVKWKGYSDTENSWLPEPDLKHAAELTEEFHRRYPDKPRPGGVKTKGKRGKRKSTAGQGLRRS